MTRIPDWTDVPAPGTECGRCRAAGHFCPAKGYLGEMPICRACGEGKPCDQALAVKKAHTPLDGYNMPMAVAAKDERRCTDCKGLLSDQSKGPDCWPCTKRKRIAEEKAIARARMRERTLGEVM